MTDPPRSQRRPPSLARPVMLLSMPMAMSFGRYAVDLLGSTFQPGQLTDPASVKLANNNKRRVTVSKFNGRWLVSIREYYEDKSGEMKPGKKVGENLAQPQGYPMLTILIGHLAIY